MRLIILSIIVTSLAIDTKCGVIESVYGKMKNTTNVIKDDIKGWISSGKDLVFGGHNHDEAKKTENAPDCNNHEGDEGVIKGLYRKVHDKIDHVKQKIHNIFTDNTNSVESTTIQNKDVAASDKVDPQNNKNDKNNLNNITNGENPTNPIQNPLKDSLVNSDDDFNFNIDIRDSFSKGNETVQNVKENIDKAVNNLKSSVKDTKQEIDRHVKDIQDKEEELLDKVSSNIKSSTDKLEKQSNSFTDDLKKHF